MAMMKNLEFGKRFRLPAFHFGGGLGVPVLATKFENGIASYRFIAVPPDQLAGVRH